MNIFDPVDISYFFTAICSGDENSILITSMNNWEFAFIIFYVSED